MSSLRIMLALVLARLVQGDSVKIGKHILWVHHKYEGCDLGTNRLKVTRRLIVSEQATGGEGYGRREHPFDGTIAVLCDVVTSDKLLDDKVVSADGYELFEESCNPNVFQLYACEIREIQGAAT